MTDTSDSDILTLPSLAAHFQGLFGLGVAVTPQVLLEQGDVICRHFTRLVAENAMKWGELSGPDNEYDFTKADTIANFARAHGLKMTGHTLVWHQMVPDWLFCDDNSPSKVVSKSVLAERLRAHIFRVMERYADVVDNWDVVNEAISDRPGQVYRDGSEHSRWYEIFGDESYIGLAFQYAAEAAMKFAPDTKLYYNDYNVEHPEKREKVLALVRSLKAQGIRIDGVGIQGHIRLTWPSREQLDRCILQLADEDVRVKVSELDISVYSADNDATKEFEQEKAFDPGLDEVLAARYKEVFAVLSRHHAVLDHVTLWGLSDDQSWLNGWPVRRKNYPLLIDAGHRPKRAFYELLR